MSGKPSQVQLHRNGASSSSSSSRISASHQAGLQPVAIARTLRIARSVVRWEIQSGWVEYRRRSAASRAPRIALWRDRHRATKVGEDLVDYGRLGDEGDDAHRTVAGREPLVDALEALLAMPHRARRAGECTPLDGRVREDPDGTMILASALATNAILMGAGEEQWRRASSWRGIERRDVSAIDKRHVINEMLCR